MGTRNIRRMGGRNARPHAGECCCVPDCFYAPSRRAALALEHKLSDDPQGEYIGYDMLETVFAENSKVFFYVKGHKAAGIVNKRYYGQSGCVGDFFKVEVSCLLAGGVDGVQEDTINIFVFQYIAEKALSDLPVRPCTAEILAELTERGRKFKKLAQGRNHVQYSGNAFFQHADPRKGMESFAAVGRLMLDPATFAYANPNYNEDEEDSWMRQMRRQYENDVSIDHVAASAVAVEEEQLWRCWPTIKGFSLSAKRWGEFFVEQTRPIEYRTAAFDTLVLAPEKKAMVLAAVANNNEHTFTDIVEGKGGGCVFLLHGPPGVGKTLTAEATAEHLQRPLYTLTSGELGTTPSELESNLSKVLELTSKWDAVLLVDECDIFLNARDGEDVTRNAMVGIFLRLLEYHSGILFLTTNRVDVFDTAVYSRISVALEYNALSAEARGAVWHSLLDAAGITDHTIDIAALADVPANGRQIKNAVRLALALKNGAMKLQTADLHQAVQVAQDFGHQKQMQMGDSPIAISAHGTATA